MAHNGSASPAYQVRLWLYSEQRGDVTDATLPSAPRTDCSARRIGTWRSFEASRFCWRLRAGRSSPIAMVFRDANGVAWFRPFTGGLVQISAEDLDNLLTAPP